MILKKNKNTVFSPKTTFMIFVNINLITIDIIIDITEKNYLTKNNDGIKHFSC